jgi:hypothetical protein
MSGGVVCQCLTGTLKQRKARRKTAWEVTQRNCNHSTFNGNRRAASSYSAVHCLLCHASWRTKAQYVDELPDMQGGAR